MYFLIDSFYRQLQKNINLFGLHGEYVFVLKYKLMFHVQNALDQLSN